MVASTSATAATDFGRELSPSERWFWIIDRISPANCVGRLRIHGQLTLEQLERATAAVVAEYPLLRMGVVDTGDGHPRVRPVDDPRIPVHHTLSGLPGSWRHHLDAEMTAPIDVGRGFARLTHLIHARGTPDEHHDLLLTLSHIIVDGRSLMTVLRKIVEYAVTDGNGDPRPPIAPSDALIPDAAQGFWRYVYTTLFDQFAALALRPKRLHGAAPVALPERRTRVVYRTVAAEPLAALARDCKRAGVTVHGALAAAVAQAIGTTPGSGSTGKGFAGIGSPVDFRTLLRPRPAADELGNYAPVLAAFVRFGPRVALWDAARSANRQLQQGIRQRRHLATVAGMRFGTPRTMESGVRIVEMVDRRAPWNVSVTNLGRIDMPEQIGARRLSDVTIAATNSCVSALTVAIVTAHDEMRISFCYVDGVLAATEAEDFADRTLDALLSRPAP